MSGSSAIPYLRRTGTWCSQYQCYLWFVCQVAVPGSILQGSYGLLYGDTSGREITRSVPQGEHTRTLRGISYVRHGVVVCSGLGVIELCSPHFFFA